MPLEERNNQINELNKKAILKLDNINNNTSTSHNMLRRSQITTNTQKSIFHSMITLSSGKYFYNLDTINQEHIYATIIDEKDIDPSIPEWKAAIDLELKTLSDKNTWSIVDSDTIPKLQKPLKYKWVFSRKVNIFNKNIYKARLTVKGCSQVYGINFKETFSPVAQITTFRLILSLCAAMGLEAYQMDVQNAFPNASLHNVEIYMVPPPQLNLPAGKLLKLLRALYGLKQASREWFLLLSSILTSLGFKICKSDSCLFFMIKNDNFLIIVAHVDDMLVVSNK